MLLIEILILHLNPDDRAKKTLSHFGNGSNLLFYLIAQMPEVIHLSDVIIIIN